MDAALWNSGRLTADFFAGRRLFEDLTDDSVRAREETLIWGLGYLFSVLAGTKPVVLYIAGAQYLDPLTLRARALSSVLFRHSDSLGGHD